MPFGSRITPLVAGKGDPLSTDLVCIWETPLKHVVSRRLPSLSGMSVDWGLSQGKDAMPRLNAVSPDHCAADASSKRSLSSLVASAHRVARLAGTVLIAWARSIAGQSFFCGTIAGLYTVVFWHQWTARFGSGSVTVAGALVAVTLGILSGAIAVHRPESPSRWAPILVALLTATWALGFGILSHAIEICCQHVELASLAFPRFQFAFAIGASALLLGVPTTCGVWFLGKHPSISVNWLLVGTVTGIVSTVCGIGPIFGIQSAAWIAAVACIGWIVRSDRRRESRREATSPVTQGELRSPAAIAALSVVSSALVGLLAAALARLAFQLFPANEGTEWTAWAGFLAGTAGGFGVAARGARSRAASSVWRASGFTIAAASIGSALSLLLFPTFINLSLAATVGISNAALLIAIRGAIAAAILFPAGVIWGALAALCRIGAANERTASVFGSERLADRPVYLPRLLSALFAGYLAFRWWIDFGLSVQAAISLSTLLFTAFAAAVLLKMSSPYRYLLGAAVLSVTAAVVITGYVSRMYAPARAARLLFSTDVFMATQAGTEKRFLPYLDDGRLIASVEGDRGTYTLWKRHGVQFHLRESGLPKGAASMQPEVCPHFAGEVLPAALPLALHEAPRRVMVLGLSSGSTVSACLEFPIAEVTCLDGDRALIELIKKEIWDPASTNPQLDGRLRMLPIEPAWGVQSRRGFYDVIVANTDQACFATGTAYYTREFYTDIAGQLAEDGIFSQRFQQVDFGPWPVLSLLATLKTVFAQVAAVEAGPGDMVLLATNSPSGLSRPGLLKRFQTPQVTRTFAQLGWDWSVALNLATYSGKGLKALLAGSPPINTAANGLFACCLPHETMRWGSKSVELAQVLGPHVGRIAQWPGVDGNDPDFLRRLAEVMTLHNLMTGYPDQPWTYRKMVQEQVQKHPHTVIEQEKDGFDRKLDPVDRRRLDYFAALGKAAQSVRPTPEMLSHVEEFAEPYDPLLTLFLHHELAALYPRTAVADAAGELRHRLFTVYYSDARDRSIRDVVDVLDRLAANSRTLGSVPSWDQMNAMLEFLRTRWANRGLGKPSSARITLNDIDKSISAVEAALAEMKRLRSDVGVSSADWQTRSEVVEQSLVRPLRAYRSRLLPEYLKETEPTAAAPAPLPRPSAN